MKIKVLLLAALGMVIVNSCTSDRDEEIKETPVQKLELKKLEINNPDQTNKVESDTVNVITPYASPSGGPLQPSLDPEPTPDPNEGDDPKNVPPRR